MNIHPSEPVLSISQGQQDCREKFLVVVVDASRLGWLPDGHMLSIQGSNGMGDVPSQPKLNLYLLLDPWGGGAGQVLWHEPSNDGPADWDDKLGDGGLSTSEV